MSGHLWALVLAGGDGTRLRALTIDSEGHATPKQYCRFGDRRSMLEWALHRAERLVTPGRVVTVVAAEHRPWWSRALAGRAPANVVVQPANRGTAPGVLLGLTRILRRDRKARLLILPSDHYVADEDVLLGAWRMALESVRQDGERVVLLGMTPEADDADYGWIVAERNASDRPRRVVSFREKPDQPSVLRLIEQGALLSTFMLASTGAALRRLFAAAQPELLHAFAPLAQPAAWTPASLRALYATLATRDLSRDVLEPGADRLRVVPVPPCGWSDLGTPARLARYLLSRRSATARHRPAPAERPGWSTLAGTEVSRPG